MPEPPSRLPWRQPRAAESWNQSRVLSAGRELTIPAASLAERYHSQVSPSALSLIYRRNTHKPPMRLALVTGASPKVPADSPPGQCMHSVSIRVHRQRRVDGRRSSGQLRDKCDRSLVNVGRRSANVSAWCDTLGSPHQACIKADGRRVKSTWDGTWPSKKRRLPVEAVASNIESVLPSQWITVISAVEGTPALLIRNSMYVPGGA